MKPQGTSPLTRVSAARRSVLMGAAGGLGLAAFAGRPAFASGDPAVDLVARASSFNLDTGNAISDIFVPLSDPGFFSAITPNDATIVLRATMLVQNAWFDAVAPYHRTAVGIYSRIPRRPSSERATNANRNIALLYASHRVLMAIIPQQATVWRSLLTAAGLDPDDTHDDLTSPIGIGNHAGTAVYNARLHDGMNQLGDEGGRRYNLRPYADYLGYKPVNTAYELNNPSRWQPMTVTGLTGHLGIYYVQQFVTPQMRVTKPYSYAHPTEFTVPPPRKSDHHNRAAYKEQADQVLSTSAGLTDFQKASAELYDNKFIGLGASVGTALTNTGADLDRWVEAHLVSAVAEWDMAIAVWHYKHLYDSVRPFTAIRYLYGSKPVTAWGGPGKGTVHDLPADQWMSYLGTADHPEYPSASAGLCMSHAAALRQYFGTDTLNFDFPVAARSSIHEPGVTPATDLVIPNPTWSDFARACGLSRNWGGVHFLSSVQAGWDLGEQVGARAYAYVRKYIDGNV